MFVSAFLFKIGKQFGFFDNFCGGFQKEAKCPVCTEGLTGKNGQTFGADRMATKIVIQSQFLKKIIQKKWIDYMYSKPCQSAKTSKII